MASSSRGMMSSTTPTLWMTASQRTRCQRPSPGCSSFVIEESKKLEATDKIGGSFLLTVGAFLLTVKLLCLQSLKALIKQAFPP